MQRKLNQRERMAYATVARLEAQLREKDQILSAVHEQFQRFGDRFPDGFDSRIFRWVADAMAGSAEPSTCQRCAGTGIWYPATGSNERQRCPEGCAPVERDERADFETWAKEHGLPVTRTPTALMFHGGQRREAGDYIAVETLCADAAWQARAALERKPS